jgi:hypothetical protein
MPVHDWTRVSAGTFHDFHSSWIVHLKEALNGGLLPDDHYAQVEQRATAIIPDVLTLHLGGASGNGENGHANETAPRGAIAVAERPPHVKMQLALTDEEAARLRQRVVTIRHSSGHQIVAMLEVVSPANKDRPAHVEEFVEKAQGAVRQGIHLMVLDLFPPGRHDPEGMNGAVWRRLGGEFSPPPASPLSLGSYVAQELPVAYVEPLAVGDVLIDMPLFLAPGWYVNAPLEPTYQAAFRGVPAVWRRALEAE